jgi:hypothetical protein
VSNQSPPSPKQRARSEDHDTAQDVEQPGAGAAGVWQSGAGNIFIQHSQNGAEACSRHIIVFKAIEHWQLLNSVVTIGIIITTECFRGGTHIDKKTSGWNTGFRKTQNRGIRLC